MTFTKEFKKALTHLPELEKDKLILRLLKKDLALADRLNFELVDKRTVEEIREEMEERVVERCAHFVKRYYSPGYLMLDLRELSGDITDYVKVTKDKYGEASLNLLMLNETLSASLSKIESSTRGKSRKLCLYVVARAFKIVILISKMHEDLWLDFKPELVRLGDLIAKNDYLTKAAIQNGLDINWLLNAEIPEDIEAIHKDIRSKGYLKGSTYIAMKDYSR